MRVEAKRRIAADREAVWEWVKDPAKYPQFMEGVTRWDVSGDKDTGCGARWIVRLQVGAAQVGGTVEIVEFEPPGDIAWNSVTGVTMRGRWRLREREPGETEVSLRLAYQAPGGLMGLIADRVAAPIVKRTLQRSLAHLCMKVEQDADRWEAGYRNERDETGKTRGKRLAKSEPKPKDESKDSASSEDSSSNGQSSSNGRRPAKKSGSSRPRKSASGGSRQAAARK